MKTEGLTFLEAVQALEDGKCEKIENMFGCQYFINNRNIVNYTIGEGIQLSPMSFLDKWKLIGVKQKVVIEKVSWYDDSFIYPIGEPGYSWEELLNKPKMKMTLEWEE